MICLVKGLTSGHDVRARCALRSQLEAAGLLPVFRKVKRWNDDRATLLIKQYEEEAENDRIDLIDSQNKILLKSMRDPGDVYNALFKMTEGTKASKYLLNSLQHLLLIKEDGDQRVRYFQLIDRLITSIVMSDMPDLNQDFARAFGISVSHVMGKFVEQERLDSSMGEIKDLKASLAQMTREKAEISEVVDRDEVVASLKAQVADLEDKLRKSRAATEAVTDQMSGMKKDYEVRIVELERIIQELYNMLRESQHLEEVQGYNEGPIDRSKLIYDLREQWERKKTIRKLEGRDKARDPNKRKTLRPGDDSIIEEESEAEDGEIMEAEKIALGAARGKERTVKVKREKVLSGSQFMDAEDERVREHIEDALFSGSDHVVSDFRMVRIWLNSLVAYTLQWTAFEKYSS
jgi:cytokinesis protein